MITTARRVLRFALAVALVGGLFIAGGEPVGSVAAAYGYDAGATTSLGTLKPPSAATTPDLKTRTDEQSTSPSPRTVARSSTSSISHRRAARGETEIVQRAMSRAELDATIDTGLVRGGRDGTHYASDAVNASGKRAPTARLAADPRSPCRSRGTARSLRTAESCGPSFPDARWWYGANCERTGAV
jgi:hypothetical protein